MGKERRLQVTINMKSKQNNKDGDEALKLLNPKFKEMRSMIEAQGVKAQLLDLKAVILFGSYTIIQALMYDTVNDYSLPRNLYWFPACLSASVSVAFWPAFVTTVDACMRTRRQQESTFIEQDAVYRNIRSIQTRRHHGAAAAKRSLETAFAAVRSQRRAYVWTLYCCLLLFTLCIPCVFLSISDKSSIR